MRIRIPIAAALVVTAAVAMPASAQPQTEHAEDCTEPGWGYLKVLEYRFGTINTCGEAVHVWFKVRGQSVVERQLDAGQAFDTGLSIADFEDERQSNGWIAATCPAGTQPSVEVEDDNWDEILNSRYECRRP
jgi:hypothetical protein